MRLRCRRYRNLAIILSKNKDFNSESGDEAISDPAFSKREYKTKIHKEHWAEISRSPLSFPH